MSGRVLVIAGPHRDPVLVGHGAFGQADVGELGEILLMRRAGLSLENARRPATAEPVGPSDVLRRTGPSASFFPQERTRLELAPRNMHAGLFVSLTNCKSFVLSGMKM